MKPIFLMAILSVMASLAKAQNSNYPIICNLVSNQDGQPIRVQTDLDGIFQTEGSKKAIVVANGKSESGFVSTVDGQDANGHGLKYVTMYFGHHLTLTATMRPAFGSDGSNVIEGEGRGVLNQYEREMIGQGYCTIYSNCSGDSRVCED